MVFLFFSNNLEAQNDTLSNSPKNCLIQTKEAFTSRIYYFLYKNDSLFDVSCNKFVKCDSLIRSLNKSKLNKSDNDLFKLLSESIIKETSNSKEDIVELSVGSKAATKTDYGEFQMTSKERTYFTFLYLVIYKINSALKK
jgi:hypothetical protein